MWLPAHGEPLLWVRFPYEVERARKESELPVSTVIEPAGLVPSRAQRVGLIGGDFAIDETPIWLLQSLAHAGIEVVDLRSTVDEWRARKSPDEMAALRRAAQVGALALMAAGTQSNEGDSDHAVAARVESAARAAGAMRVLCLVGIGRGAVVTEASGVRVGRDDPVGLEVTLWVHGACVQVNGTLLGAQRRPEDIRAFDVCHLARQRLLEAMRPGTRVDDVVASGDQVLQDHGLLEAKEYDFGHGVGADTPEYPRLIAGTDWKIQMSQVLAVHVAVRRPAGETAFVGGPVVIEASGPRELVDGAPWVR
jgi:Xaa-Pro aminopeptidase